MPEMPNAGPLLTARLIAHRLLSGSTGGPVDVVRRLGAVQAQDFPGALWGIAQRVAAPVTEADMLAAFDRGELIRTHLLRPTWHLVAPEDLRGWLALTAPRIQAANAPHYRSLDLDARVRTRAADVFARTLADTRACTRDELAESLRDAGFDTAGQRLVCLLMHAELEGVLCSGPRRGRHATYMRLDARVPERPLPPRQALLTSLITRYVDSHGPVTVADAAWWSGLTMGDVRAGIAGAGTGLTRDVIDGVEYWRSTHRDSLPRRRGPVVHLLPNFDEYTVAYRNRTALLHPAAPVSSAAQSALLSQPVMVDGRHAGAWRRPPRARQAGPVDVQLLDAPSPTLQRAVDGAVARYTAYLEGQPTGGDCVQEPTVGLP